MTNNDILRRLRYALNINNTAVVEIFALADYSMDYMTLDRIFKKEEMDDYLECSDDVLDAFLDGLIISKRGKQENKGAAVKKVTLNNNVILKKIRIALELRDDALISIIALADLRVSKSELSALFRKKGHKNYRECKDQFLRYFLKGLTTHLRK